MKSYYERPLLKRPHWDWKVAAYLFAGGVMGASGVIALLARRSGDEELERKSHGLALGLSAACPLILISHLGRPERFLHMLRVFKRESPMSLGSWGLVAYSNLAAINVLAHFTKRKPPVVSVAFQALVGAFMTGYTGVLLSATANPIWAKGKYHIPAISVCSAISGACAANAMLVSGSGRARAKLERLETVASLAELALLLHFRSYAGKTGDPMFAGARGKRLRSGTITGGIIGPLALSFGKRPSSLRTLVSSALTLAGAYVLRDTLIEAAKASADDPHQAFFQTA